jgi:hypothetical protein
LLEEPASQADIFALDAIANWGSWFGDTTLTLEAFRQLARLEVPLWSWGFVMWRPVHRQARRTDAFKDLLASMGLVDYWRSTGNWGDFCRPVGDGDFECL